VIFKSDTRLGRLFDAVLLTLILLSVAVVMLDSMAPVHAEWGPLLETLEWIFTGAFTIEYGLRLACVRSPLRFARSGLGIIDALALAPTWLALFFPALHTLIGVRVLRLLRIFRLLRLGAYISEFIELRDAIFASRRKIATFISFVLVIDIVAGTLMYVLEGPQNGFSSVPVSVYWAITTMTTVGFGDIAPKTDFGRFIASAMMLMGWGTLDRNSQRGNCLAPHARAKQKRSALPAMPKCRSCRDLEILPRLRCEVGMSRR
jgi:voltage-gated potassium channel